MKSIGRRYLLANLYRLVAAIWVSTFPSVPRSNAFAMLYSALRCTGTLYLRIGSCSGASWWDEVVEVVRSPAPPSNPVVRCFGW